MIGKITGTLTEIDGAHGLIETSTGVSYLVYLPTTLLATIPPSAISVYTYLQVREDALTLYGFETRKQYQLFDLLLSVDGVGPKTAFTVVSTLTFDDIVAAVGANDVAALTKVPGLGKKTAMKIILELSTKLKTTFDFAKMKDAEVDQTALDALVSLGFKVSEARAMLKDVPAELSTGEKVSRALQKK